MKKLHLVYVVSALLLGTSVSALAVADRSVLEDSATTSPEALTAAKLENSIGTRCATGEGVPQNYALAAEWFEKAARHGYGKAEYNLGTQYYFGQGVKQDYAKAAYWWEQAAAQGIASAQYNLGNLYYQGIGVPQDFEKAAHWWQMASEGGIVQAKANLEVLKKWQEQHLKTVAEKTTVTP
ncbi:tetratricopeptide repeat protein [Candidatus Igneacidithiobacillus taiwanensis]|uniref:tetratricopeptide repeat protein n=1 Tax=Candidatus Igneacidithiobacillus taiwanensis TaxID=1945924 RepID=UPI00289B253C|nr:tetratricopeptide repeat protein [Candidatus Igneacidithiobacillus taiwanensis]